MSAMAEIMKSCSQAADKGIFFDPVTSTTPLPETSTTPIPTTATTSFLTTQLQTMTTPPSASGKNTKNQLLIEQLTTRRCLTWCKSGGRFFIPFLAHCETFTRPCALQNEVRWQKEGNDECCNKGGRGTCKLGEGDCDYDSDCEGSLVCGDDNCTWGDGDDCCKKRGKPLQMTLLREKL